MEDVGRDGATRDTDKGAAQGTLAGPRMGRAQKVRMLAGTAAATAARGAAVVRTYPDHE
ncbi:unnamed protein product [Miscanthus lutarioriparius]|uniref:Uncharacterized protein n=1 Tax=Miscanthus lutarioriparius TaxID=422564 RepID=A0A811QJL2_9POAL|nr:unnamed protein product [Miscanthus lutarioriparius]